MTEQPLTRRAARELAGTLSAATDSAGAPRAGTEPAGVLPDGPPPTAPDHPATEPTPSTPTPARRSGSLWSWIANALVAAILVCVLAFAGAAIVVPAVTGSQAYTVLTGSMVPSYPPGTLVIIRPTDPADIAVGDVVTYQLTSGEPTVVTHRVRQVLLRTDGTPMFITQGDHNATPDPDPVAAVQIRGTLWYAIPVVGWVSTIITPQVRGWLIPLAVVALGGYALWMWIGGIRDLIRSRRTSADSSPTVDD